MAAGDIEGWTTPQKILVLLAHADDPEFFLGGSIARWSGMGHQVDYCLFTRGDKGVNGRPMDPSELAELREQEQKAAASVLGVKSVQYLGFEDGYLVPSMENRRMVVRTIRSLKPDVVVSCDPTNYFYRAGKINHPDHRAAGQIVVDAVFPAAGNPLFFPELIEEQLEPHGVKELWLSLPIAADISLDVTATWEQKFVALQCHHSQIPDVATLRQKLWSRRTPDSTEENPRFLEHFRRIVF
jgi:LmbE family N-acetylglucosaminyl deacetylase